MSPAADARLPDWEAFYRDYRRPGYVPGFEITTKLGGGVFGLVFRARKVSIGKDYAIKFLKVEDAEIARAVLGELEQVKYFAQIDHPNLVSIEDRGEVDGIPYLVMQFAGTETLRDKLRTDGVAPTGAEKEDLLRWFLQACRGIAALHERSLVHFDVKPANVFLKGPVARVGDYGLSKLVTHSRGSLTAGRGTPYYMAPELLQRRGDARSDVYSLGVVLYELLCGQVPFRGDSEWEVLKKHEHEPVPLPGHLTALERAVLQRCLQKDPAARYQGVHDLIAALGAPSSVAAAAVREAAPVEPPPLPSCVAVDAPRAPERAPAPLPGPSRAVPPPPMPRRRRFGPVVGVLFFLLLAGLALQPLRLSAGNFAVASSSRNRTVAQMRPDQPVRVGSARAGAALDLNARIDTFVAGLQRNLAAAVQRQRTVPLRELDDRQITLPGDLDDAKCNVESLARARAYSAPHAAKLLRDGRSVVVAAVALLQELDYADADDCLAGAHLLQFLEQACGVDGFTTEAPDHDPSRVEQCRFQGAADAWRRFAEQFARTDADFQAFLAAKQRPGSDR